MTFNLSLGPKNINKNTSQQYVGPNDYIVNFITKIINNGLSSFSYAYTQSLVVCLKAWSIFLPVWMVACCMLLSAAFGRALVSCLYQQLHGRPAAIRMDCLAPQGF